MNSFGHGLRTAAMLAQLTFVLALLLQAGAVLEQGRAHHLGTRTTSPSSHGSILLGHDGQLEFTPKQRRDALAWGVFVDSAETPSNFGKLRVVTSARQPDHLQMRAAGFLEGWLTAERIFDHWTNVQSYFEHQLYPGVDLSEAASWLEEQERWLEAQVEAHASDDPHWRAVGLVMAQFNGLVEGYQARACQASSSAAAAVPGRRMASAAPADAGSVGWLDRADLMFLNNNGELYDIIDHLQDRKQAGLLGPGERRTVRPDQVFDIVALRGRCSALIKVAGDLSDVFIGHSTWDSFTNALRIFKHYEINLNDPDVKSRRISFSSYPGELFSDDDMYITDTRLVVVETTLHIFRPDLLSGLSPLTIPSWYRVRASFLGATSGEDWVRLFGLHNSGTYNNQYMVVDLNRFEPYQEIKSGFLWVVEQIPELVSAFDATHIVLYSFWPSFNVPFLEQVYNATGYPDMIESMQREDPVKYEGQIRWLKYQIAPRMAIWRRDQGKVHSLEDMKAMMRYNNWRAEPLSYGHPAYSICGRYDLLGPEDERSAPTGCYDSKVTSYHLARRLEAEVVNGPPLTEDRVPFSWQGRWGNPQYVHRGHPTTFNFSFERMSTKDLPLIADGDRED